MNTYWVVGHPLSFCLTTEVMNGALRALGTEDHFETHDLESEEACKQALEALRQGKLAGIMVTRPYKKVFFEALDSPDKEVQILEAANWVTMKNGKLHGSNTDWLGAKAAITQVLPELAGLHVHILGAGGAARAVAYACQQGGAKVSMWNRTQERAKASAELLGLEWVEDMRNWNGQPDVIINATSASDQPNQSTLVPYPLWAKVQLAMDAVYGKTSLFLEEAKAMQVPHVLPGEAWFIEQCLPLYSLITEKEAPRDLITQLTRESKVIRKD